MIVELGFTVLAAQALISWLTAWSVAVSVQPRLRRVDRFGAMLALTLAPLWGLGLVVSGLYWFCWRDLDAPRMWPVLIEQVGAPWRWLRGWPSTVALAASTVRAVSRTHALRHYVDRSS